MSDATGFTVDAGTSWLTGAGTSCAGAHIQTTAASAMAPAEATPIVT